VILGLKTLKQLRIIINGDNTDDYRTGPELVEFFSECGFDDQYGQGFPSRWFYTDEKLKQLNGTPELDKCIRNAFAVVNYIGRIELLDALIADFNKYLAFDKWKVIRDNDTITFKRLDKVIVDIGKPAAPEPEEDDFLKQSFAINIDALELDSGINEIIKQRVKEVESCINSEASLASIFMIGSIMEGLLLSMASKYPRQYNQAQSTPKGKNEKPRQFADWTLSNYIDVSAEIGLLKHDVKKFSHVVRDYRNFIHPYEQMCSGFSPDKNTALICFQVLKAAISQIQDYHKKQ
jgi:hypothetical protein